MYNDFEFPFEKLSEDERIATDIEKALVTAVKRCLGDEKKCALFFSGGIDSSIVAKILLDSGVEFTAYVVGMKRSQDIEAAKRAASELGIKIKVITLEQKDIPELVKAVIWTTKTSDPITVGVGIPLYAAAKEAAKDNYKLIFSGSGSDEIFAGYESHAKALLNGWEEVHRECVQRVHEIDKDIMRDASVCKHFSTEPRMPFMDIDVVRLAMATHPKLKISAEQNKIILRKIAQKLGLPEYVYERKKKAAQYGSGVNKAMKKISKEADFDSIGSYLKGQFANIYKNK